MQNKGALKLLVIALLIASFYALSFTFVSNRVEKKADAYAGGYPVERQDEMRQNYLDSMRTQTVYNLGFLKFSYKDVKEKEINLGLDLKGGMNVLLEISPEDIVRALSNNNQDPNFLEAMRRAKEAAQRTGSGNFVGEFVRAFEEVSPGGQLVGFFSTPDIIQTRELSITASNQEVAGYLQRQVDSAIDNSYNVLSKRIDKFGVTQPNIQRVKNTGRILIELPGIKEPERVRKLLQGSASLEFWMTYDATVLAPILEQIDATLRTMQSAQAPVEPEVIEEAVAQTVTEQVAEGDTTANALISQVATSQDPAATSSTEDLRAQYPLLSRLDVQSVMRQGSPIVGVAMSYDTAVINTYLGMTEIRNMLPQDLKLMWGVKAIDAQESIFELYAIRDRSGKGLPELDGGAVENATGDYKQMSSEGEVSMAMNREGASTWERITRDAVDANNLAAGFSNCVAIVLDNYVYSAPGVREPISGGRSSITGNFTIQEAKDLANVLKSGKLPAPARIVQDTVVGPTLGQESINASMISFILAFILVLIYMILFYNRAGVVASIALICNLILLFGVLVSFGFVLTLPGIAGIVLTMGMAVDANVIIYERIKEELRGGKALGAAVAAGYKNAMSAIIDANITTVLVGIILVWFGTGPVQGFATTLLVGIITSFFTSVFVTRLLISSRIEKGKNVTFSNKLTRNFLANTKIDFLGMRKVTYIISIALIAVSIFSLSTRGLNRGVDFTGGRAFVVRFDQPVSAEDVRSSLESVFASAEGEESQKSIEVKQFGNENQMRIVTQYLAGDDSSDATARVESLLYEALNPLYGQNISMDEFKTTATNPNGIISSDTVEASVAHEIVVNSFWAVGIGLLAIGLYIILRFRRWQWGAGSVIALGHDAFLTIGAFSLFYGILPFNLEVDQSFIAAILTIIGYSINDKVVIFDRIREYHRLYPKRNMRENINNAVNSTLSRTINTSGTTIVTLLAIFLFGGEVIRGFVFALLLGIIISTYSSVFTATPVAYDLMRKGDRDNKPSSKVK